LEIFCQLLGQHRAPRPSGIDGDSLLKCG
jgi:hypothetical protein